ncbi:NADPH dehydrogenase [Ophiocordyceps sinensis CO18]|nr:NADPH dehydrogenase [Ophiocordyceps sinensis CO18]
MARRIVQGSDGSDTVEVDEGDGQTTQADVVLVARQFLREPNFVLNMAKELGVAVKWPNQYHRAPRRHREAGGRVEAGGTDRGRRHG